MIRRVLRLRPTCRRRSTASTRPCRTFRTRTTRRKSRKARSRRRPTSCSASAALRSKRLGHQQLGRRQQEPAVGSLAAAARSQPHLAEHELQRSVAARRQPFRLPGAEVDAYAVISRTPALAAGGRDRRRQPASSRRSQISFSATDTTVAGTARSDGHGRHDRSPSTQQVINTGVRPPFRRVRRPDRERRGLGRHRRSAPRVMPVPRRRRRHAELRFASRTADVGTTAYIKVSQYVSAALEPERPGVQLPVGRQRRRRRSRSASRPPTTQTCASPTSTSSATRASRRWRRKTRSARSTTRSRHAAHQRAQLGAVIVRLQRRCEQRQHRGGQPAGVGIGDPRPQRRRRARPSSRSYQILVQVGTSVFAQSNSNAQSVPRLFR